MPLAITIDDSQVVLMQMKKLLNDQGYDVLTAKNGKDGIDLVGQNVEKGIDIVFIDYNMAGLNGIETAEEVKKVVDQSKIFLLTANIQAAVRDKAEALGISFVEKPLNEESLKSLLDAM